jgi:hypothetical protein
MFSDDGEQDDLHQEKNQNCDVPAFPAFEQGWPIVFHHNSYHSGK